MVFEKQAKKVAENGYMGMEFIEEKRLANAGVNTMLSIKVVANSEQRARSLNNNVIR